MATGITKEDFDKLSAPFQAQDHEFNRGFIYIEETAICARIEEVDLSWEWKTIEIRRESDVAYVMGALTINGVTRYGTGQQVIQRDAKGGESVGEATKGATTDAMKRAARLFGIGRYLLQCPKTVKDYGPDLNKWLASLARGQAPVSDILNADDKNRFPNFLKWASDTYKLTETDVMRALYTINNATFKQAPAAAAKAAVEKWASNRKAS